MVDIEAVLHVPETREFLSGGLLLVLRGDLG